MILTANAKGNLFVLSGPSGVGKDTLMALIFEKIPNLSRWVTCTTRKPRAVEVEGKDYFFKTLDEFSKMNDNGELVEVNKFADNYYGTPKSFAKEQLNLGNNIITAIDVHGAFNVKKAFPNAHLIFIEPPSLDELSKRLYSRGTETQESINKRLKIASSEIDKKSSFDICVVNDELDRAAQEISEYIHNFIK